MSAHKHKILKFRAVNRNIFEAILNGKKKIETRAATAKFHDIKAGDTVVLICGNKKAKKKVKKVELLKSSAAVLKKYKPEDINPKIHTIKEVKTMWYSFPGYREKIKKHGFIVMHLG